MVKLDFLNDREIWLPKFFCGLSIVYTALLAAVFFLANLEQLREWDAIGRYSIIATVFFCVLTIWMSFRSKAIHATNLYWISTFVILLPCIILTFSIINVGSELVQDGGSISPGKQQALYFSVVTFTTLGYGDFSPSESLRPIAAFQALMGFTFIPLLIAELIKFSQRVDPGNGERDLQAMRSSLRTLLRSSITQQENVEKIAFEMNSLGDLLSKNGTLNAATNDQNE